MSKLKKLVLSASVFVTMLIALVIGFVGMQPSKIDNVGNANNGSTTSTSNLGGGASNNIKVEKDKPKTYTYEAGDVVVQKGTNTINYNYQPNVDSGDSATVIAY